MRCTFTFRREGTVEVYEGVEGDTYEQALRSFGIVPDTVLILCGEKVLTEDEKIEAGEVVILTTASRG